MPLKIRWVQKDYLSIALILLGACGLFQSAIIFIAQYLIGIGNYLIVIIIPAGATLALFYCTTIIFESYSQVERRKKIRSQFQKKRDTKTIKKFMMNQTVKPLLIVFSVFSLSFIISILISYLFFTPGISFIIAENVACVACLLVSNLIERNYAKVRKY
ncbi:MAG: hypothetical protein ACFFAO_08945 [Candidatus Hermodarchaeota archaeon]